MATLEQTIRKLKNLGPIASKATARAFFQSGNLVVRQSKLYSPISPTKGQINSNRKRKGKTRQQPQPGRLKNSIRIMSRDEDHVAIGVPSNSEAGDYAYRIHSLKNKPGGWKKRGIGTQRAGPQADELFISRAIEDKTDDIITIFGNELEKALDRL